MQPQQTGKPVNGAMDWLAWDARRRAVLDGFGEHGIDPRGLGTLQAAFRQARFLADCGEFVEAAILAVQVSMATHTPGLGWCLSGSVHC